MPAVPGAAAQREACSACAELAASPHSSSVRHDSLKSMAVSSDDPRPHEPAAHVVLPSDGSGTTLVETGVDGRAAGASVGGTSSAAAQPIGTEQSYVSTTAPPTAAASSPASATTSQPAQQQPQQQQPQAAAAPKRARQPDQKSYLPVYQAPEAYGKKKAVSKLDQIKAQMAAKEAKRARDLELAKQRRKRKPAAEVVVAGEDEDDGAISGWALFFSILLGTVTALAEALDIDVLLGILFMPFISAMKCAPRRLRREAAVDALASFPGGRVIDSRHPAQAHALTHA